MQKLVRAAFGTNNVDTCARVCHSPTGYGLKHTLGESAGTQEFVSVQHADVIMVIGASPTEAHPVFASQMKRRLRAGAQLIVVDPRAIALVKSPHVEADYHLRLLPGTNVAVINALAHVVVTEGLTKEQYIADRCEQDSYEKWKKFVADPVNSPEAMEKVTGVPAALMRGAARLYARGPNSAIYYGLGVTEHSQGTTMVMGIANLAMATGNLGREGVGVSPLRGQNNVQGSCDMGSFPHEFSGYRHVSDDATRALFESMWKVQLGSEPGLRIPEHVRSGARWQFPGPVHPGRGLRAVRSEHRARDRGAVGHGMHRHSGHLPQRNRRNSRMCSCRALRSWRKTAHSRMPNGAFPACARSWNRWRASRTGKSPCGCRMRWDIR